MTFIGLASPKLCNRGLPCCVTQKIHVLPEQFVGLGTKSWPVAGLVRLPFQEDLIGWLSPFLPSFKNKNPLQCHPICFTIIIFLSIRQVVSTVLISELPPWSRIV